MKRKKKKYEILFSGLKLEIRYPVLELSLLTNRPSFCSKMEGRERGRKEWEGKQGKRKREDEGVGRREEGGERKREADQYHPTNQHRK